MRYIIFEIKDKELSISDELNRKIDKICRFACVKYEFISGNIKSVKNTNIAYVKPHILIIGNKTIIKKQNYEVNNFSNYIESVFEYISINNKIKVINGFIKSMNDNNKKIELIYKIEEIIKMYQ